MSEPVIFSRNERIVTLSLNRPDTRNALSRDLVEALIAALIRADSDESVSCVIINGQGKGFSSGGNLQEIKAMTATQNMSTQEIESWYSEGIQQIPITMNKLNVVTIAAVHGHAIGAGCDLTCMCDFRIAGASAMFAESFLKVGIIPGDGGTWFLPRVIGQARTAEMLLTAKPVDALKALEWGLVKEVVPDDQLADAAMSLAKEIAALPPQALRKAKALLRYSQDTSLEDSLQLAATMQAELQQLDDHHEAIDAIVEKRTPQFTGH